MASGREVPLVDPSRLPHGPRLIEVPLPRGTLRLWCPAGSEALLDALVAAPPDPDDRMPYWADLWPAAIGLAQAIDAGGRALAGRTVLELGCGLGLVSLAAARAGARAIATDWDLDALAYVGASARENALAVESRPLDWRAVPPDLRAPVVVAADVLYEERNVDLLVGALDTLLEPRGEVWMADPGRRFVPAFFERLGARWRVATARMEAVAPQIPRGAASIDLYRLVREP